MAYHNAKKRAILTKLCKDAGKSGKDGKLGPLTSPFCRPCLCKGEVFVSDGKNILVRFSKATWMNTAFADYEYISERRYPISWCRRRLSEAKLREGQRKLTPIQIRLLADLAKCKTVGDEIAILLHPSTRTALSGKNLKLMAEVAANFGKIKQISFAEHGPIYVVGYDLTMMAEWEMVISRKPFLEAKHKSATKVDKESETLNSEAKKGTKVCRAIGTKPKAATKKARKKAGGHKKRGK